jgi:hypothetical protein
MAWAALPSDTPRKEPHNLIDCGDTLWLGVYKENGKFVLYDNDDSETDVTIEQLEEVLRVAKEYAAKNPR